MSDIFEIVPEPHPRQKQQSISIQDNTVYVRMQSEFINCHLGYYTNQFIDVICQEAKRVNEEVQILSLHKILKDTVKKFMMSDLQLVYFGFTCKLNKWNFKSQVITANMKELNYFCQHLPPLAQNLNVFCSLVAFFVKKYVGDPQHYSVLDGLMQKQSKGKWNQFYQQWLSECPLSMFKLSPRKINNIYSQYTKNCQKISSTKNYNKMVDQVMQLSTTYAMIPGQSKENKKRKNNLAEQTRDTVNQQPYLFGRKILKIDKQPQQPQTISKLFDFNNNNNHSSIQSNYFLDAQPSPQKSKRQVKLSCRGSQQTKVNKHVTDIYKQNPKDSQVLKKYVPHSTIGMQGQINFFDSKMFSSGQQIIPYTLRSNSNMYKSKLYE